MTGNGEILPRISIVIPCYNGEDFLGNAIESCLALDYPDVEIVVVDDGSADGSVALARRYEGVTCIPQANQGQAAARNTGIRAATGEFFVFLDHDDELMPDALCIGHAFLQDRPEASFAFGVPETIGAEGEILSEPQPYDHTEKLLTYADAFHVRLPIPPSLALFRREIVRRVGGFDSSRRYAEDLDFFLRVLREAPGLQHNAPIARYRRHGANMSRHKASSLEAVLAVLDAQVPHVSGDPAMEAELRAGKRAWARFFGSMIPGEVFKAVKAGEFRRAFAATRTFVSHAPGTVRGAVDRFIPGTKAARAASA
jgi:hypothetical protein